MGTKLLACVFLLFALACKAPSASEQMDSAVSWLGTAGMAAEAWLRHGSPDKYTKQTLELSHDSLLDIGSALFKSLPAGIDSATVNSALTRSSAHIALMAQLVEQKDAPQFRSLLDSLYADERAVRRLADNVDARAK